MSRSGEGSEGVCLVMARHAESTMNAQRRFCGRSDATLSERGRAQAAKLARELAEHPFRFDGVFSSNQRRAIETARPVAEPTLVPGLAEVDQGELEGLTFEEGVAAHPEFFARWHADPASARIPGGEALTEAAGRVRQSLLELAGGFSPGTTLFVVGHQLAFATVLAQLRGAGAGAWTRHALRNAEWTRVWVFGDTIRAEPSRSPAGRRGSP